MAEHAIHVTITGRVQGVGYRAWLEREAVRRRLTGWVRNRRDGSVEAVFAGPDDTVTAMVAACRDGPRAAVVSDVSVAPAPVPPGPGFRVLPTD